MIDNRKKPFQNQSNAWLFGIFVVAVLAFSGFKFYSAKPSFVDRSLVESRGSASRLAYANRSAPLADARQQPTKPLDREQELLVAATSAAEESDRSDAITELGAFDSSEIEQALTQILLGGGASQPRIRAIDALYAIATRNPERIDSVFYTIQSAMGDQDPDVDMQARLIYDQLRVQRPEY